MKKRFLHALHEASELRAFIVLAIMTMVRAWRSLQNAWHQLPSTFELIELIQHRVNARVTDSIYKAHWI